MLVLQGHPLLYDVVLVFEFLLVLGLVDAVGLHLALELLHLVEEGELLQFVVGNGLLESLVHDVLAALFNLEFPLTVLLLHLLDLLSQLDLVFCQQLLLILQGGQLSTQIEVFVLEIECLHYELLLLVLCNQQLGVELLQLLLVEVGLHVHSFLQRRVYLLQLLQPVRQLPRLSPLLLPRVVELHPVGIDDPLELGYFEVQGFLLLLQSLLLRHVPFERLDLPLKLVDPALEFVVLVDH